MAILRHLIERAAARGLRHLKLHAQTYAIPFYAQARFVRLARSSPSAISASDDGAGPAGHRGTAAGGLARASAGDGASSAPPRPSARRNSGPVGHARPARRRTPRTTCIYTRDLEPAATENPGGAPGPRSSPPCRAAAPACPPLQDPARVVREGHRLVDLAHRLSSVVQIRRPSEEDRMIRAPTRDRQRRLSLSHLWRPLLYAEGDICYPPRRDELKRLFD